MYFCGYFVLSYVPNWEAICIVPIFGLVFGKIWVNASPRHDHIYVTPHCFTIKFEEAPSCFVLNAFLWLLCITKWSKLESSWNNTNIWDTFFVNLGIWVPLRPPRVTVYRVNPYYSVINFVEKPSSLGLNVFLWLLFIIKWSKLGKLYA